MRAADARPANMRSADMRRPEPTAAACPEAYSAAVSAKPAEMAAAAVAAKSVAATVSTATVSTATVSTALNPPPPRASASSVIRGTTRSSIAAMQTPVVNTGLTALRDSAHRTAAVG